MATNPGVSFGFASSQVLCSVFSSRLETRAVYLFNVSSRDILEPYQFDRHEYAQDLFGFRPGYNDSLCNRLKEIDASFEPDIIISFTQNRYLEALFTGRVLFWELSPLPRVNSSLSLFMDPFGHQVNSIPNLYKDRIRSLSLSDEQLAGIGNVWHEKIVTPLHCHPLTPEIKEWLSPIQSTKQIALLALQPPDWPTYEAAWRRSEIDQMIMQCTSEMPTDWVLVPIFHPDQSLPEPLCRAIESDFAGIRFPPRDLSSGKSELFLPHVDAVISISSSLSVQGIFHGKKVITLGQSQFSAFTNGSISKLDEISPFPYPTSALMLAFLSNRYSHPLDACLTEPNYVAKAVRTLAGNIEAYFDFSEWSPSRLAPLLGPVKPG
ncbi:hypothetical protein FHT86_002133 [Rhizobium sp. BK313]|uniref:hypothetical protein n=1 Tax=Rhizobium sp. BK313 TaxID=2587081 RepID=UPI0016166292|nr:hypothetical protein [Rhizobium sp. BK313]MBB3453877.1 hypothetical protein [Rhizobium sp. BK313]